jgi:diaminohydroxyphosphoribosylaminopyrimidine deaminase / 5-amino-6-(5-phosphoribosylamino)uracil reductase
MSDEFFMRRCFQLARQGACYAAPNPMVGAVVVNTHGQVLGEGFHRRYGGPHAEVEALQNVAPGIPLNDCTLYVNLEPCSHQGKTPPCASLIIEKGVGRVVISNIDPNPLVKGKGIRQLEKSGIRVVTGVNEHEGWELNKRFFTFHQHKRPYVILKWAVNEFGFMAPPHDRNSRKGVTWISNESSRLLVHQWRSEESSVLVGKNTITTDDPLLTSRYFEKKNPIRIVIDPYNELHSRFRIFNSGEPVLIFNLEKNERTKNVHRILISSKKNFIRSVLKELHAMNILSVFVEGGRITIDHFIKSGLWDEARVFTGSNNFNDGIKGPSISQSVSEAFDINGDLLNIYRNMIH